MKKLFLIISLICSGSALFDYSPVNWDSYEVCYQDDPAREILEKVSENFKNLKTLKAEFSLKMENPDANIDETQTGKVFMNVENQSYRLETDDIVRITNTKAKVVHTVFVNEEEYQINDYDADDSEFSPMKLFTIYQDGFTYKMQKDADTNYSVIDLIPNKEKADELSFTLIRIYVDRSDYLIKEGIVFEKNRTKYTYKLADFVSNEELSTQLFELDSSYADFEEVDLRD